MAAIFVNAAILHIFDFSAGTTVLSQSSLNMDDTIIETYVHRQIQKIMNDLRCQEGCFHEESQFLKLMNDYSNNLYSFVDYSLNVANMLEGYLKNCENPANDVLIIDYTYDDVPYVALLVLENQMAYTHLTKQDGVLITNTIIQQHSLLPSATKKISTFAYINKTNQEIHLLDQMKWNVVDVEVMQEMILDCSCEKSKEEVLKEVHEVVKEVAIKTDTNPTLLLSKYKNYVKDSVEEEVPMTREDLAANVFNESEEMQNTFISASLEHELPKEVEVPKQYVTKKLKNQKIKTDTGIELSFPTEYSENSNFIEFVNHQDGTITIEIKNIGKITNKA